MKVIGIAGYARCGKDTFVGIAKNILSKNKFRPIRVAFADKLKEETEGMLRKNAFNASVYTEDSSAKSLIRPLLVWWGCQRRNESVDGLYWVDEVDKQLQQIKKEARWNGESDDRIVVMVSDVRFPNEAKWVHQNWGGEVIHLKRYQYKGLNGGQDGSDSYNTKVYDPAPNEEEKRQDPMVEKVSDHRIEWESKKKLTSAEAIADPYLESVVFDTLNQLKFFRLDKPVTGTLAL